MLTVQGMCALLQPCASLPGCAACTLAWLCLECCGFAVQMMVVVVLFFF